MSIYPTKTRKKGTLYNIIIFYVYFYYFFFRTSISGYSLKIVGLAVGGKPQKTEVVRRKVEIWVPVNNLRSFETVT